ncbi:PREDICTED: zinc finger CCCH domain-containing protein 3 [Chrysochloris asiatica]|uniref:Zinc finger CCCH domain-containing protein 3 n=1 Tax=Chrysochloris asiatica TaxID=185453 RepID=A0A9B0WFI7_CHRAS|nr:PREDICTED: zinc finger CCCH domain-containing protein 3 [Chrysochloris asiatica]
MEEKEQLRRQIRLLQGLIDDYRTHHGNAPAPCASPASRWQPSAYHSSRSYSARYPRPSRRGFAPHHGPPWCKKYSLVNRPQESAGLPVDPVEEPDLGVRVRLQPGPQPYVLERQVQLSPDQSMVIKIKPPPAKPALTGALVAQQGPLEQREGPSWRDQRPQEGEGEPPGGKLQPPRPGRVQDPLLVCQKEPGRPRAVRSVSSVSRGPPEPRRTVSEGAIAAKGRVPPAQPQRSAGPSGRKVGFHSASSCSAQPLTDRRADAGHPDQPAPLGLVTGPGRAAPGLRQAREASLLGSCRTTRFRKNNYKWVATSAKSPRAARRALSPRAAASPISPGVSPNACRASGSGSQWAGKPQTQRADSEAKPRKAALPPKPGASPSKYKWKASSPSAIASSFHWQPEAGPLSPVLSQSSPDNRWAAGPSGLKALFGETPLSGYKVKSRTKIIRRRGSASLPGDRKSSPPSTSAKNRCSLRRRQVPRGKSSPVLKKTPTRGLLQVTRHRLCRLPPGRIHLPAKEACSPHTLRMPPTGKVIKTRYRIVKKSLASPLSNPPVHLPLPTWSARRLSLSRSSVLKSLRPAATGAGKSPPGAPRWRNKGYRCIGGVLYRVSANKLSKTSGRLSDAGSRPLLRTGRLEPASSCSHSLVSRAVQRSLAIIRQARQKRKERREEYCMYYNRFGRCNRGQLCPYIHDPEKVAVCTRFLRGTCKKTDGTCPFSHHVSKDKMPVCSYFLKGICSNSSCPYSHVYVSRKAEVCQDFLKGYCPLGTKCKKKHTLLCPDFSRRGVCPRGPQCQLLHRSQKCPGRQAAPASAANDTSPRSRIASSHGSRKLSAAQRPSRPTPGSPCSMVAALPPPPSSLVGLALASSVLSTASSSASLDPEAASVSEPASAVMSTRLPSFISLRSSPSPARQPSARPLGSSPSKDSALTWRCEELSSLLRLPEEAAGVNRMRGQLRVQIPNVGQPRSRGRPSFKDLPPCRQTPPSPRVTRFARPSPLAPLILEPGPVTAVRPERRAVSPGQDTGDSGIALAGTGLKRGGDSMRKAPGDKGLGSPPPQTLWQSRFGHENLQGCSCFPPEIDNWAPRLPWGQANKGAGPERRLVLGCVPPPWEAGPGARLYKEARASLGAGRGRRGRARLGYAL